MTKIYNSFKLTIIMIVMFSAKIHSQCITSNVWQTVFVNSYMPTFTQVESCNYAEESNEYVANVLGVYTFSVHNNIALPIYLTLTDASNNPLAFGASPLSYTITTTGSYYLHITQTGPSACLTNTLGCHFTDLKVLPPAGSPTIITQPVNAGACVGNNAQYSTSVSPAGCTFQWEEDQGFGFTPLSNSAPYSGVTTPTLTISNVTSGMSGYMYHCVVTNTAASLNTNDVSLSVINIGTLPIIETFNASTNLPTGWITDLNNQFYVMSNHGTGGTNGMSRELYGSFSIKADATTPRVGPMTSASALSFDYRIVNWSSYPSTATPLSSYTNDSIKVYASNNCGSTYTLIGSISASNHTATTNFTNKQYSLASFSGNNLVFKFVAVKDPLSFADYYVDIDNVNVSNLLPNDAGVTAFLSPVSNQPCYLSSQPLIVTVKNYGTNSLSNIPVKVFVSGAVTQTITGTLAGPLAANTVTNFTVGSVNMSASGTYVFKAFTDVAADPTHGNDTLLPVVSLNVNNLPTTALPLMQDFNATTNMPANWMVNASNPWYVYNNHGTTGTNGMTRNLYSTFAILADVVIPSVGPMTANSVISFDYRIVNYSSYPSTATPTASIPNDSLNIYVSSNCGASYSLLGSINAGNHTTSLNFVNKTYSLASYASNSLVFKFVGKKDPSTSADYYLDVDNINIFNSLPNDASLTTFNTPPTGQPCYSSAEPVSVTIKNNGTNSINNIPVKVFVSGAVNQTLTGTYTGTLAPTATANFTVGNLNMLTAGTYTFKAFTQFPGDPTFGNDTILPVVTRTVIAVSPLPYTQDFNATTNMPANWNVSPTDPWYVMTNHGTLGSNGMTRNLYSTFAIKAETNLQRLGTITPSTSISFDYRYVNYGSYPSTATPTVDIANDTLKVMTSVNCGVTFSTLGYITGSNHVSTTSFANKSFTLGALAGSDVIFKFIATKTPSTSADYYIDVDNINLYNVTATDAGVSALLSPSATGCYSVSTPVVVSIKNYGLGVISNIPVSVTVAGPTNQTITATYTNTIAVGATVSFTVGNANMGLGGIYTFTSTTNLPGDGNTNNDVTVSTITVSPLVTITGPSAICIGNTATLTINGTATSYTWSTSSNSSSITVNPTSTTVYSVTGTDANSCTASGVLTVSVQNPTIAATGATGCGSSATGTLSANAFSPSVVNWYATPTSTISLATGTNYAVSAAATTTYYAEASSTANGSLFTTLAAGNGFEGNMFDVTALNNITISSVDMHFLAVGTVSVQVWYRPGSFVGFENSNAGWTMAHSVNVPSTVASGSLTPIPGTFAINIPSGQTYGIYVTATSGATVQTNYTNGTLLGNLYTSNSDLKLFEGKGGAYFNVINVPRVFNGRLNYTKQGCTSPKVPVVFTVSNVTAASTNTVLCSGNSTTLTATGANNYTWMPGNLTTSSVVVSPTTSTNYTVTGVSPSCTTTAVQSISVNPSPVLSVTAAPSVSICPGMSTTLTATSNANNYTWTPVNSNSAAISVTPAISTVYNIATTNSLGCTTNSNVTVFVIVCTGIAKNTVIDNNTFIYPNPNNGNVNVVIQDANGSYSFEVLDLAGRMVYKTTLSKAENALSIKELANGMYTYKITSLTTKLAVKEGKLIKE